MDAGIGLTARGASTARSAPRWSWRTALLAWGAGILPFAAVLMVALVAAPVHSPVHERARLQDVRSLRSVSRGRDRSGAYLALVTADRVLVLTDRRGWLSVQELRLPWASYDQTEIRACFRTPGQDGLQQLVVDRREVSSQPPGIPSASDHAVFVRRGGRFTLAGLSASWPSEQSDELQSVVAGGSLHRVDLLSGRVDATRLVRQGQRRPAASLPGVAVDAADVDGDGNDELLTVERDYEGLPHNRYRLFTGRDGQWRKVWELVLPERAAADGSIELAQVVLCDLGLDSRSELIVIGAVPNAVQVLEWDRL